MDSEWYKIPVRNEDLQQKLRNPWQESSEAILEMENRTSGGIGRPESPNGDFPPGACDCRPFGQPQVDRAPPFFSSKFIQHKHDGSRSLDHGKSTIIYDAVGFVTKLGHMYFILLIIPGIIYK